MPTLHQFVPTLDPGAVGTHVLEAQRTLRAHGWCSEVFSEHTVGPYDGLAHRFTDYGHGVRAHDDDVLVYHVAIGSSVADWLLDRRPPRLVLDYHNITPPEWFAGWEPAVAYGLAWGRAQLRKLAPRAGQRRTAVLPILLPDDAPPDAARVAELREEPGSRWVFVGRLAPNKRQHLLIAALHVYRRAYDPSARLDLVGGASSPAYEAALRAFARDLGLGGAVTFTGPVSDGERNARYAAADVLACLSAHEGFLVPIVEAWRHDLPVVAWGGAPAVAETMGDAGVLVPEASPDAAAAAIARVVGDPALAGALRARGEARAACFGPERTRARLLELAEALAGGLADRPGLAGLRQ